MKRTRRSFRVIFLLPAFVLFGSGQAASQTYDFQSFTVENGLSQSQILCIYQVATGELWMGTNQGGINRYDGSSFNYLTKVDGLSDNVVYAIKQEASGRILVGTNNGLNVINGSEIKVWNVENGLPHKGVVSMLLSSTGEIWLGTGNGVARLLGDTIFPFKADTSLSTSTILNIREGPDGSIWFCTVQNGLFRWNGKNMLNITVDDGLARNYVYDVMPAGDTHVWVFGYNGLYRINGNKAEDITPEDVAKYTGFYGYERDRSGTIWIGTTAGVLQYREGQFKHLTTDNGLVNNDVWKILQDREGNVWFGSKSKGISKLNSERFKIYNSTADLPNLDVNSVFRTKDRDMWLGTERGLAIWDGTNWRWVKDSDGLSSESIRDIDQDSSGTVYVATDYGLTIYGDGRFTAQYETDNEKLKSCWDVFCDATGTWVGTRGGPAFLSDGQLTQPLNANSFNQSVYDALRKGNDLWFAYEDGVLRFDGEKFMQLKAENGFFDGRTRSLVVGPEGNLWFGTNNGVYRYDGVSCVNFSTEHGLISDAVYSLAFHQDGSLWVGQQKGMARLFFDGRELKDIIRYQKEQGFLGLECNTNSIWMDDDGKIWIGTANGLVEYDPSLDKGLYYKPLTRLTGVKLFAHQIDWADYADSVGTDGIPIGLKLPFNQNHLTFEYSGVSLTSPASINYSYMVEGLDDDWQPLTNSSEAKYSNIPPGKYTFKVKAGFGEELWNNEPVTYDFEVLPPFYKTRWFYMFCMVVAFAIIYSYYTIRRANVQITAQKQKIESQKDVIETKNQEMVDSINYAGTIQSAILPSDEQWNSLFPDSFVLYRPKDIVSGDFYWVQQRDDDIFFAAVDCTGHGVPGALMSIVGYTGLNQAIKEHQLSQPAAILDHLSLSVNESLRKSEHADYVRDGMDIALCKLNSTRMKLEFAGAFNPLLLIRNGEATILKADRIAIGGMEINRSFTNNEIDVRKGDCLYIYSDGYADQFGGELGKKMKANVMRERILEFSTLSMREQLHALNNFLNEWQGDLDQVDDICVIGIRI